MVADLLVNCTGFERCTVAASPLLASLARAGIIRPDPTGLDIDVDEHAATVGAGNDDQRSLYALGPLTAGRLHPDTLTVDCGRRLHHGEPVPGLSRAGAVASSLRPWPFVFAETVRQAYRAVLDL